MFLPRLWYAFTPQVLSPPTEQCFVLCFQALYKGAPRVILATENDYCKLCDASFSSLAVAQAHYQGKNHAKKLRLAEAQHNSNNMWVWVEKICGVSATGFIFVNTCLTISLKSFFCFQGRHQRGNSKKKLERRQRVPTGEKPSKPTAAGRYAR